MTAENAKRSESWPLFFLNKDEEDYGGVSVSEWSENSDLVSHASQAFSTVTSLSPNRSVFLAWKNLSVTLIGKKSVFSACGAENQDTSRNVIIENSFGIACPGQILAIIGPSGSGKTTLLNGITYKDMEGYRVDGELLVNGQPLRSGIRSLTATVEADELFFSGITVKEHIIFHALLRLPAKMSKPEKIQKAKKLMRELGLHLCRNTPIEESPTGGLSKAEKKLVSFGTEALTNPAIFACDEPTTDLDAFMAKKVISILRRMAARGKTVICTVNQPTSEVYASFDKVLFLTEGQTIFFGRPSEALHFFSSIGFPCPSDYNPSDYFLEVISASRSHREMSLELFDRVRNLYSTSDHFHRVLEKIQECSKTAEPVEVDKLSWKRSRAEQFQILFRRSLLNNLRNRQLMVTIILNKLIMGILIGFVYWKLRWDQTGISNVKGVLFFLLAQVSVPACLGVIRIHQSEFPLLLKENTAGLYHVSSYYWSRSLSLALMYAVDGLLASAVAYFMIGLGKTASRFLLTLVVVFLVEQTSVALGLLLSTAAPSFPIALGLAGPLLTVSQVLAGMMINVSTLQPFISWLQYLSLWRYGFEALSIIQWHSTNITCGEHSIQSCVSSGDQVLADLSFSPDDLLSDILLLIVLNILFNFFAYLALLSRITIRKSRNGRKKFIF